jgi:HAD superfamily hydrolase (TIGR01509 family)
MLMSLPDAVILDMDGLMYDTERIWQMFWSPVLLKRGIWYDPAQGPACSATNGKVKQDILRSFYGDDWDVEGACREFSAMAKAHLAMLRPHKKPGLDELIAWCHEHRVPLAIASSSSLALIGHHLERTGLEEDFDSIVSGEDAPRSKPYPDIFLMAAHNLAARPEHSLVCEDSFNGVRAAAAGGFNVAMVPDTQEPDDEMRAKATVIVESLHEVRALLDAGELPR